MAYEYDCFISYAHQDDPNTRFAQQLTDWLRRAKLTVWRDSSGIQGGEPIRETIQQGLASSRCLVCLVTDAWYASRFVQWEVDVFREGSGGERPVIPVFLTGRDIARLGPYLSRLKGIAGLADRDRQFAAFWELYCAITGTDLGQESDWDARGRGLLEGLRPGYGGLLISGLPVETATSAVRVYGTPRWDEGDHGVPWDGDLVPLAPGLARVKLVTLELFDEQEVNVRAGEISSVWLKPMPVIWPTGEPRWHPGFGPAKDIRTFVVNERATQQVLAGRIAHIANRVAGHPVILMSWTSFKEDADGALERFISVNSLFYHEDDRQAAQALHRQLRLAKPPIRLAMHEGGSEPRAQYFGVEPFPDGCRPKRMHVLLVEDPPRGA